MPEGWGSVPPMPDDERRDQVADTERWEGPRVRRWLAQAEALDRQLAPVTELLFEAAALQPGERVLDVGCGSGPTTRQAAVAVGSDCAVVGLDVSPAMLEAAASAPVPPGSAPIEWLEADVARWSPSGPPVDVVISRFGVMFFDDPAAAFAALATATRPGGRLAATTWDRRDRSAVFQVPLEAVTAALRALGRDPVAPPLDQGAFSLHDPEPVTALLTGAGWVDVAVEPIPVRLRLGGGVGPDAAATALDLGPSRVVTEGIDPTTRDRVRAALAAALAEHVDAAGHVVLGASVVRITARRP